ncbi:MULTISPECIES: DUF3422 family protein [unclassified Ruegeria]|uniref:DUF3422 family protein n=1 Tax=unclassified Ruegeria TaxID=2625375 RepID=UPI0014883434|nr:MULTISPECIES: DUF3422 domain-containing protein [unclassified Ruegeria]NOD61825.1 DUF3422 family protein [Ruegeria sp. HKCCD6109]NOD74788.1 DUF3422 family protein [Ruegeria sp. HKCCD4332]NOD86739.1 DUF3422 family protein [Ruegeria sp. HKCCD4318]NOD92191.1 DUF3422 family protein [Ruegeria sp. HKCCD4884]NOE12294.1 DUF3422 family protein [Ruegeria sp. HKCCD4318-2]
MTPIDDHPLRYALANELHARPFPVASMPCTVVFLAIKKPEAAVARDRSQDLAHLINLLDRHGAQHPQPDATHYAGQIGRHWLKWEQHTEFVTYTAIAQNVSDRAFNPADFEVFPLDWLMASPGQRVTSVMVRVVERESDDAIKSKLLDWFEPESLAVARVLDDAAVCASDFRIDPAGHMRFALFVAEGTGRRRTGRIVQRLCEIETYKAMSMLGFARVKQLMPRIGELDGQLTRLMGQMTDNSAQPDSLLQDLLSTSIELETLSARCSFRFGATGAYEAIVNQRIEVLREERFQGGQNFADFMMRRYDPAIRTVKSTERRLQALSDRAIRAGELLRTRVDVERSAQNQALLESMDRRADLALRLQHTVEGLSVVAISYYAVSLVSYLLYPLTASGISKGMLTAAVTVPVVAGVWFAIRRIRKRLG